MLFQRTANRSSNFFTQVTADNDDKKYNGS